MNLLSRVTDALIRQSFRRVARQLARADSQMLLAGVSGRVLGVFQGAAKTVPAYRLLLDRAGVDAAKVTSLELFRDRVPILNKESWFGTELREICTGGSLDGIASFYSSSGHTGNFSYGVETRSEQRQSALAVEFALQQAFKTLDRKTLLINCLPMAVRVHTRFLPVAETSVREDVVWSLFRKLAGEFEQFVLIGEHVFLKHMIERGAEQPNPIEWAKYRLHLITGAEYIAENFRSYLASRLGIDPANPEAGSLVINYGLSELSASIAQENWHTIQIRRLAHTDVRFREALCGGDTSFCPKVMQYFPSQVYLETHESSADRQGLVVTMLTPDRRIPMIRYHTGDRARLVAYPELAALLREFGHAEYIPPLQLPLVLLWGKSRGLQAGSDIIYPEQIKEAIYADPGVAEAITGLFRLRPNQSGLELIVQLREKWHPTAAIQEQLEAQLRRCVGQTISSQVVAYAAYPFGLRNDYERKNQYLAPGES